LTRLYPYQYNGIKPVRFLGDSLKRIREFPADVKQDCGYQLDKVQRGQRPDDFKPMPSVGKGVEEIRVWDDSGNIASFIRPGLPMRFMCSMRSKRRRSERRGGTLISLEHGSMN